MTTMTFKSCPAWILLNTATHETCYFCEIVDEDNLPDIKVSDRIEYTTSL